MRQHTLSCVLATAGYPPGLAPALLARVNASPADNALVGFLIRQSRPASVRRALAEMPAHARSLCYARMVAFGMTEDEITRLMPL